MRASSGLVVILLGCSSDATPLAVTGPGTPVSAEPALVGQLFTPPVPDPAAISSTFGPRWKGSANRSDFHPGIDYFDALGTPVFAIGPGTVEHVYPEGSTTFPNGGNVIVVRHALASPHMFHGIAVDHIFAVYLHLFSLAVADGELVTAGQTIGAMGMTGDTEFVHLHFEIRAQTLCSMQYQVAHPDSTCALGFDPHVHPFVFVGGDNIDVISMTQLAVPNAYRYVASRGDLDLDVIETDRGLIGFSARDGLDATSLTALDNFDRGWLTIVPEPFTSASTEIAYELRFAEPIRYLAVRDLYGNGVRYGD